MPNLLQDQFNNIQNAFGGARYNPSAGPGMPGSYTTPVMPAQNKQITDQPMQNGQGVWVSSVTKQPWTGSFTDATGKISYYNNGASVASIGAAQAPTFTVTPTAKDPAVAGQVAGLVKNDQPALLTKSFNDYLNEANTLGASGATSLAAGQAAVNPAPTIAAVDAATAKTNSALDANNTQFKQQQGAVQQGVDAATGAYTGSVANRLQNLTQQLSAVDSNLASQNNAYAGQQQGVQNQVAAANQGYADTANTNLTNLGTNLTSDNATYATAAQNVASQAYAQAQKQIAAYQMGTGTPTSGSGNLDNRYMRAYADINIPLQQQLAQNNLNQTNQLYSLGQGLQNTEYGNTMNQFAGQSALNSDITNRGTAIDQYLAGQYGNVYGLGANADSSVLGANLGALNSRSNINTSLNSNANNTALTTGNLSTQDAQYVAQLKQATAGMSNELAAQYLQQIGAPIQVAQAVLAGQTSNLAGLNALDQSATSYTLSTPYQNNAPTYATNSPRLPNFNSNLSGGGAYTGTGSAYGGAPLASSQAQNNFQNGGNPNGWVQGGDGNWYSQGANGQWQMVYKTPQAPTSYGAPQETGGSGYSGGNNGDYSVSPNYDFSQPNPFTSSNLTPAQVAQMQAQYS